MRTSRRDELTHANNRLIQSLYDCSNPTEEYKHLEFPRLFPRLPLGAGLQLHVSFLFGRQEKPDIRTISIEGLVVLSKKCAFADVILPAIDPGFFQEVVYFSFQFTGGHAVEWCVDSLVGVGDEVGVEAAASHRLFFFLFSEFALKNIALN